MQNTLTTWEDFAPIQGVHVWVKSSPTERQLTRVSQGVRDWDGIGARLALRCEGLHPDRGDIHAPLVSLRITGRALRLFGLYTSQEIACRVVFENDLGDERESCAAMLRCPTGWTLDDLKETLASAQV